MLFSSVETEKARREADLGKDSGRPNGSDYGYCVAILKILELVRDLSWTEI